MSYCSFPIIWSRLQFSIENNRFSIDNKCRLSWKDYLLLHTQKWFNWNSTMWKCACGGQKYLLNHLWFLYSSKNNGEKNEKTVENKKIGWLEFNLVCVIITVNHWLLVFNDCCGLSLILMPSASHQALISTSSGNKHETTQTCDWILYYYFDIARGHIIILPFQEAKIIFFSLLFWQSFCYSIICWENMACVGWMALNVWDWMW